MIFPLSGGEASRALLVLSIILAGCGGKSLDNDDGGNGSDGGNNGDSSPGPNCPASAQEGDHCSVEGIECEYGSDIRSSCNKVLTCSNGTFTMSKGFDPTCPTSANSPSCPASPSSATGTCSDLGLACNYSTSTQTQFCTCNYMGGPPMIDGGMIANWQCSFGTATGCPAVRPKIGSSCSQPDLDCNYDVCGAPQGLSFQCNAKTGTWVEGFGDVCAGAQ
jgi:hypothetical protein